MFYSGISSVRESRYFGMMLLFFISVICVAFSMTGNDDFVIASREVLLRRIGHELLLQSGDSTCQYCHKLEVNS